METSNPKKVRQVPSFSAGTREGEVNTSYQRGQVQNGGGANHD